MRHHRLLVDAVLGYGIRDREVAVRVRFRESVPASQQELGRNPVIQRGPELVLLPLCAPVGAPPLGVEVYAPWTLGVFAHGMVPGIENPDVPVEVEHLGLGLTMKRRKEKEKEKQD